MKRIWGAGMVPVMAAFMLSTGETGAFAAEATDVEPAIEQIDEVVTETEAKSLPELVEDYKDGVALGRQGQCLATAVYFEARSEGYEGQLAVADVILNRAESAKYPSDWCAVVKQKAQFSFVRGGQFPKIRDLESWEDAQAIARIAIDGAHEVVRGDVLWYHADYVRPSWRHRLNEVARVGVHVFYAA